MEEPSKEKSREEIELEATLEANRASTRRAQEEIARAMAALAAHGAGPAGSEEGGPGEPVKPPDKRKKEKRPRRKSSLVRNVALAVGLAATGGYVSKQLGWWGGGGAEKAATVEKKEKDRLAQKAQRLVEEAKRLAEEQAEEAKRLAAQETKTPPEQPAELPETKPTDAPKSAPATPEPRTTEVKPLVPKKTGVPKPALTTTTLEPGTTEVKPLAPATPPESIPTPKPTRAPEPTPVSGTPSSAPEAMERPILRRTPGRTVETIPRPPTVEEATATVLRKYPPTETPATIVAGRGAYGGNIQYGTTSSAYGTNTGPGYDINPEGIRAPGEFSPGFSEGDNLVLQTHPEFVQNNPFHLTGEKLIQAYRVYEKNIAHIFQSHSSGMEAWEDMKEMEARELLGNKNPDPDNLLINYIQKLHNITKVPPRGGIIRSAETVEHYIARALQWAAKIGKLSQVKEE